MNTTNANKFESETPADHGPLRWLTPWVCRALFAALVLWGAWSHVRYLNDNCPIDLSGDEAQYWDWSRDLDWSYYSKGPAVAWLIRGSCAIFGDTMPAVRYPAVLLGIGTGIVSYLLIVKLLGSERLALGYAALMACVPAFVAGSVMMTIDPPFFFCWGLATLLAAVALFDNRKWVWPVIGVVVGLGFLAKYAMLLWLVCLGVFLVVDAPSRRWWRSGGSGWMWSGVVIALLFTAPVLIWNAQHDWVSLHHVQRQTSTGFSIGNPLEMLGGQAAIIGPGMALFLIGAIAAVVRRDEITATRRRGLVYLLVIGGTFFAINFIWSFRTKIQPNWPAPAYFTLLILATWFAGIRSGRQAAGIDALKGDKPLYYDPVKSHISAKIDEKKGDRPLCFGKLKAFVPIKIGRASFWRVNLVLTVVFGLLMLPVAHDASLLYRFLPMLSRAAMAMGADKPITPRRIDFTYKLRGHEELGGRVGRELAELGSEAFVVSDNYQTTAVLSFYVPGQPKACFIGSYWPVKPARHSQYDLWPDRSLEPTVNGAPNPRLGRDAIYVGYYNEALLTAFEQVEPLESVVVKVRGHEVREFDLWRCRGFKGLNRPTIERY